MDRKLQIDLYLKMKLMVWFYCVGIENKLNEMKRRFKSLGNTQKQSIESDP